MCAAESHSNTVHERSWSVRRQPCGAFEIREGEKIVECGTAEDFVIRYACDRWRGVSSRGAATRRALVDRHNQILIAENLRLHEFVNRRFGADDLSPSEQATGFLLLAPCLQCKGKADVLLVHRERSVVVRRHIPTRKAEKLMSRLSRLASGFAGEVAMSTRRKVIEELRATNFHAAAEQIDCNTRQILVASATAKGERTE